MRGRPATTGSQPGGRPLILHVSTVHQRRDVRILFRECVSLADTGRYDVRLAVADGKGAERLHGVDLLDLGAGSGNRLLRALGGIRRALVLAFRLRPALVHVHDPELIPVAFVCRLFGMKAVFDMHENVPLQIMTKPWIRHRLRLPVSRAYRIMERALLSRLAVVFAEASYAGDYRWLGTTETVLNFPDLGLLPQPSRDVVGNQVVYLGGVTIDRGVVAVAQAVDRLRAAGRDLRFLCVGKLQQAQVTQDPVMIRGLAEGWLEMTGALDPQSAWSRIAGGLCGMATLRPTGNYVASYPTKIFEYMALGMPVIASDFPLYRDVVEASGAGRTVDPTSIEAIAGAIAWLQDHPDAARDMGRAGRQAVESTYNWVEEAGKLDRLYQRLLSAG